MKDARFDRYPFDLVDWSRAVKSPATARYIEDLLRATRARRLFELAAYVWILASLGGVLVSTSMLPLVLVGSATLLLPLVWLGARARRLWRASVRSFAVLVNDYPSR